MKPTLFRCPMTGQLVQHFIADHPNTDDVYRFDTVRCDACGHTPIVNRATGSWAEGLGGPSAASLIFARGSEKIEVSAVLRTYDDTCRSRSDSIAETLLH